MKIKDLRLIKRLISYIVIAGAVLPNEIVPQTIRIGVALPLYEDSDEEDKKQLGSEILNGIKFALSGFDMTSAGVKVEIVVRDTKKEPESVARIFSDFGADSTIEAILGPVFSSELSEVVSVGKNEKIPIISPTATGDELASTHDYVFQLNPPYEVRGRLMARYLIRELGMKNFAVISEESYGSSFTKSFENEVKNLGGKILLSGTYASGTRNITDIVSQLLKVIRDNDLFINLANLNLAQLKKVENSNVRYSLIDSLVSMKTDVSIYYLFGRNAKKIIDTLNIKPVSLKSGTAKFIQGYIDAIYIPISNPSEIGLTVPELFSNSLSFYIAGTGDWNSETALKDNKPYIKNLVFESEYYPDESSNELAELKESLKKTKYKLNKSFLFGYDAMSLILHLISEGYRTRQMIYEGLKNTVDYRAIKSKISLNVNRVNTDLNILTYDNGIKLIQTYKLQK